jgi:hypothetical protein
MATSRNRKSSRKSRKNYKKSRRGGANECERLPFSQLSYNDLHSNYQKYCTNFMDKNFKNKDCCNTLKTKFRNWTTDGRDFENQEKNREYDDQYNKINNIPEEDIDITENFMRPSMVGGKSKKKSRKSKRK